MDKILAGASSTTSSLDHTAKKAEFNSKISSKKAEIDKLVNEAGKKVYEAYLDGKNELTDEVVDLYEKCGVHMKEIEKLEQEKAELIAEYESRREAKREELRKKEEEAKSDDDGERSPVNSFTGSASGTSGRRFHSLTSNKASASYRRCF